MIARRGGQLHEKHYSEMLLFSHWTDESKELPLDAETCIAEYVNRKAEIDLNNYIQKSNSEIYLLRYYCNQQALLHNT